MVYVLLGEHGSRHENYYGRYYLVVPFLSGGVISGQSLLMAYIGGEGSVRSFVLCFFIEIMPQVFLQ